MNQSTRDVSLGVSDDRFPEGLHLCHVFNDDAERRRTIARYFSQGLKEGERALWLVDNVPPEEVRAQLAELGLDVAALAQRFLIGNAQQMYCPTGDFNPDMLLDNFGGFCRQSRDDGFSGTRIGGDMGWAIRTNTGTEELLNYEVKVKDYLSTCPATAVCEYDARKFSGSAILDVLSVHPAMIVRGQIVRNPYYVEPADYLARYRARHAHSA